MAFEVPPEFWLANGERIDKYLNDVDDIMLKSLTIRTKGIKSLRSDYSVFRAQALSLISPADTLRNETVPLMVSNLGRVVGEYSNSLQTTITEGMSDHIQLAEEQRSLFVGSFVSPNYQPTSLLSISPELLSIASDYSADLVGLSQGGLSGRILHDVNRVIRLTVLGAGPDAVQGSALLNQALGGPFKWSYEAERIYMTEVMRVHSIALQASFDEVSSLGPIKKQWRWSGIRRKEHARINGQQVNNDALFRVPLRKGGTVRMRFPRDPNAVGYPSAVINCGCTMVAIPQEQ
jgi:hypothetical protein